MKKTDYQVGMLVDHPNRPNWGPGKIVHVDGLRVYVFFRDALERKARPIVIEAVQLSAAKSQTDAVLDELPNASHVDGSWMLPGSFKHASLPVVAPDPNKKKVKRKMTVKSES